MKKLGLFKRIGLTATTLFVCLAMLITCFTFVAPYAVKADETDNTPVKPITSDAVKLTGDEPVKVKSTCDYGKEFAVPAGATVTAPNGDAVEVTGNKVKATQLGVYKVSYTKEGVSYDFKVSVSLDKEYFLFIKYNGADIPTYVENDSKFTLPEASVKYYDENNILQEYPDSDYTIEIEDSWGNSYNGENKTFTASKSGKVFITYTATLGKTGGTKLLTKTFTVNVQSNVNKSGSPTLAVSGITKDASVNRPVTLPVATVSDKNDDNVKVVIQVFDPSNNPVKNVKVNDDGYAYETTDVVTEFDNNKAMTFYPTETGKYKVTYTAYNDFYDETNPTAGGKSSTSEAIIEVADHVAPVFKNTDKYEYLIPETWGAKSVKNENGTVENTIKFLIPEVVDNKCHMPVDENDKDNLISLYFRITDSDNSKTVLTINNILSTGEDGKFTKNNVYDADATFNNEEKAFVFDFNKYKKVNSAGESAALAGTYTVLFRARDKDNNTSSKTYTIVLKDEYEDKAKPSAAEVTAPDYISVADETITVPYPVYADKEDTRPYVVYRLYTDAENYIDVKGGETAKIVKETKDTYLVINEDKESEQKLKLGDNLYYYIGVTDKVGNFRSNALDGKDYVDVANNAADYEKISAVSKVIDETETDFGYAGNISFVKYGEDADTPIYEGDKVKAGSFVITAANADMRFYTGFEVAVYDPMGKPVGVTLETVSDEKDDIAKIYVKDIWFNATLPTEDDEMYTMTVKVFDVNGNSVVYGYTLKGVNKSIVNNGQTSAIANIGTSGNVNVTYKLHNSVIKSIAGNETYRVVRRISGGNKGIFSVMGNELTAKTAASYSITDGYIKATEINEGNFVFDVNDQENSNVKTDLSKPVTYHVSVSDDAKPVIELQGKMPTYKEKYDDSKEGGYTLANGLIKLPTAIAYTENGMGEIEIDVKDPDGSEVDLNKDEGELKNTFKADKDGVYTVTYSATYQNGEKDSVSYTINVGDVFAPKFTVTGGTSTSSAKREGDTFTFKSIELAADEKSEGVTVTKEIYDPSHELISGSTVSGGYSGYHDKENNGSEITLSKVGEYTIVYTAKDAVGNEYKITETLTVTSKGSSTPTTWTTLSTVLIIVAVLLLAGVIIYVVRFRKVKK